MASEAEAKRPVDSMLNADARADMQLGVWLGYRESVPNNPQRRVLAGEVEPVMLRTRKAEGLAETRGPRSQFRSEQAGLGVRGKAAVARHRFKASHWFECTKQDSAGHAVGLAGDIEAVVLAVDGVNIRVTWRAEEDGVTRRGTAMGVGCRVRWIVMRTEVGFDLYDAAGKNFASDAMDEKLAEQARRDEFRWVLVKGARHWRKVVPDPKRRTWDNWSCVGHG